MCERIARKFTDWMIIGLGVKEQNRQIYQYAWEVLLLNGTLVLFGLLTSIALHQGLVFLVFLGLFSLPRQYLGGFHLKNSNHCLLCSCSGYLIVLLTHQVLYRHGALLEWIVAGVLLLLTLPAKPLATGIPQKDHKNKMIANGILLADALVIIIMWYMQCEALSAGLLVSILALLLFWLEKTMRLRKQRENISNEE